MRYRVLAVALACATAAAPVLADVPAGADWALRLDAKQAVSFRGMAVSDGGKAGVMMYPAPGVIGLVAGIAVHGAIASAARDRARSEAEQAADKVVDPFRASLAGFTQQQLALAALGKSRVAGGRLSPNGASGKVVDSSPVFYLTPEQDALVLENSVVVSQGTGEPYRNTILIVSEPYVAEHPEAHWGADDATRLKFESADLLALSLDIALEQATAPATEPAPYRTVRYLQGKKELFERAQVLGERCGRVLIRNLRGWLMSVPLAKPAQAQAPGCAR